MRRADWILAVFAPVVGLGLSTADAQRLSDQAPAGLREEVVLSNAQVGTSRLSLSRFRDPRAPQDVIDAVTSAWSARAAPIRRDDRDGWLGVVQAVGDFVEVLQVQAGRDGGSVGRRARWRGTPGGSAAAGGWLDDVLPAGSQVLQRIAHDDPGRRTATVVALTGLGPAAAVRHVTTALERLRFIRPPRGVPTFQGKGEAVFLQRGQEEVALTVSELDGRRAVVLHWGAPSP